LFAQYRQHREFTGARARQTGGLLRVGIALFLSMPTVPVRAQESSGAEYRAKAQVLANLPSFVEWTAESFPSEKAPFLICVFGDYPFGISLAELTHGISVQKRRVAVRAVHRETELHSCQILFVGKSEHKRYKEVLEAVRGRAVLTVGETAEFLKAGGIVGLFMQESQVRFDVNLDAANRAHLKISSRMLALARGVSNRAETAKD
jgi:hypothetical protein